MLKPPLEPMEAATVGTLPDGDGWQYEPKWDGFRCLAFRDGPSLELFSKSGQPLARYFPELVEALLALSARRFVLDGEIVVPEGAGLSFDDLLQRIHPAPSRIRRLSKEHPATYLLFDLLAEGPKDLLDLPLRRRRAALEKFAQEQRLGERLRLSPKTEDFNVARGWFETTGAALDGVMAKRLDAPYERGGRTAMLKVKHYRSADCVVGGFRYGEGKAVVGSLLRGLYDGAGVLHHVGFCSGLKARERPEITRKLEALLLPSEAGGGFTGSSPGGPSRWKSGRSAEWKPLAPKRVVEVSYDHFSQGRFRHGTRLLRWRPDKAPRQCTLDQVAPLASAAGSNGSDPLLF
jgi:ATP-dependent DNA ligase